MQAETNAITLGSFAVDELSRLFGAYDRGTISRRQLFQALGLAAVASTPFARRPFAQGQCAGRDRDTTAACNHTPAKAPFDPTGWKTRSNDGQTIAMDIGDWGGVEFRGGYTPPARGAGRGGGGGGGGAGRGR